MSRRVEPACHVDEGLPKRHTPWQETRYSLEDPGVIDLVMIKVRSGEYLGEDDIVWFEDVYGRSV